MSLDFLEVEAAFADFCVVEDLNYFRDFLILPPQIVAAHQQMNSLWPEIHRTRQFFHVDDDPFWKVRDLFGQLAANGSGLLALCD